MSISLPTDADRLAIIGKTGSGKTVGGLWHLSLRSWPDMPWIILDYKRDEGIAQIPGLEIIDFDKSIPQAPGIYAMQPVFDDDDNEIVEHRLLDIWTQGRTGLFIDEGYMVPRHSRGLRAILTQGRSLRVPVIMLSQRPSWISPFLLSESDYIQLYHISNPRDVITMGEWIPHKGRRLDVPQHKTFRSLYFDVAAGRAAPLLPVPPLAEILDVFDRRRPRRRRPLL